MTPTLWRIPLPSVEPGGKAPAFSLKDQDDKTHRLKDYAVAPSSSLLADPDHEVAEKYGAWRKKSMYGKTFRGLARTTFVIGRHGTVVRRWDNVKADGHAEAVLEAVESL